MKTNQLFRMVTILLIIIPLIYLATIYNSLPLTIPTHFGIDGTPDKFGERSEIFLIAGLVAIVSFGISMLMWNLKKIDPKKAALQSPELLSKISFAIVAFMSVINFLIIRATQGYQFQLMAYLPVLMGIFFSVMGNFMHSVKPNYFVGIRTPWTLENEEVWKKTHQLGGKLWFVGGILIAVAGLLFPSKTAMIFLFCCVAIMALVPVIYSFTEYKKLQRQL